MRDYLTTPKPDDSPALRGLRLRLSCLRYAAERIEINATLRRAALPAPRSRKEFERFRRRGYDAVKRAKAYRHEAAAIIEQITAAEERAALAASLI